MVVGAVFGAHPDRRQADPGLLLDRARRLHPGRRRGADPGRPSPARCSTSLTYGFTTIAAFGLVTLVRDADGEATHLSQWSGLARKSPVVAAVMTILLMSMAGIPLTTGFIGKFFVFRAAYHDAGAAGRHRAGLPRPIAAFFYLRIIVLMFFAEPPENGPTIAIPRLVDHRRAHPRRRLSPSVLGVFPQPILDLADNAAHLQTVLPG